MSTNKLKHPRGIWLVSTTILLTLLAVFIAGQFTPVVAASILKQGIDRYNFRPPPDFETIEGNVIVHKDIPYNERGTLLDIYSPKGPDKPVPVVMWIHGGGFIGGKKENTQAYAMTLASAGYVVANINYDLAPEYKYPVPVIQANQALHFLRENVGRYGGDINRLFLGSNSAGSHIASQVAALISNQEYADQMRIQPSVTTDQLKGLLLYDGIYNVKTTRSLAPVFGLYLWAYTGVRDFEHFDRIDELSIPGLVTSKYPPVFITVGDADPLEPQSIELLEVLRKNEVETDAHLFTGTGARLGHDFMMDLDTQPAREILAKALAFLKRRGGS